LEKFVDEYFDQNPISQLGILTTSNKRAEKIAELGGTWSFFYAVSAHILLHSGNPKRHIQTLRSLRDRTGIGEPSLQNALDLAAQTLKL
jgi:transcription initiation factor TFIIH subunit 2